LGDADATFDLLERAISNGRPFWKDWIENDSDLDAVRSHPRYAKVIALLKQKSDGR
jgi:adenylate cyclase